MEKEYNIVFEYDDESIEVEEIIEKGWRSDVKLEFKSSVFQFHFYDPIRIKQDLEYWVESQNFDFIIDGILIVQNQLDNKSVREKIEKMCESGYFD